MKNLFPVQIILTVVILSVMACSNDEPTLSEVNHPTTPTIELSRSENTSNVALNSFGIKLFNEISKNQKSSNIVFSPTSMAMSVAMIANATDRNTEQSVVDAIGCDNIETLNSLSHKLMQFLPDKSNKARLLMANSIWHRPTLTPSDSFVKLMGTYYFCPVNAVNFETSDGMAKIEKWCRDNTAGLHGNPIADLPNAVVACINALHFEGSWVHEFDPKETSSDTFHGVKEDVKVDMMHNNFDSKYFESATWECITIPYNGSNSMLVFLPKDGCDINALASAVSIEDINTAVQRSEIASINLAMPKFKSELKIECTEELNILGVNFLPSNLENFTGEKSPNSLTLEIIFRQNVSISTDETGSVASAVSVGAVLDSAVGVSRAVDFTLDRPFIYMIRNSTTGSILIAGIFAQP